MQPSIPPPPRRLQLHHKLMILVGGARSQVGWLLLAFNLAFFAGVLTAASKGNTSALALVFSFLVPLVTGGVGLYFVVGQLKQGMRSLALIAQGEWSTGQVIQQAETGTKIAGKAQYKLTVEFPVSDGQTFHIETKTVRMDRITSSPQVLYFPDDPAAGILYGEIPYAPRFTENGTRLSPHWIGFFSWLLPGLTGLSFLLLLSKINSLL